MSGFTRDLMMRGIFRDALCIMSPSSKCALSYPTRSTGPVQTNYALSLSLYSLSMITLSKQTSPSIS
ncbi:MAG: hypothetical protein OEZ48_13945, partial [Candidatus Bathyarchaeota archaeon]|nr:hypothetical protein [Candidatus Bathyarchaeota archaeon]